MLCLTVWGVGIPLLFAFVLWYYRKEIDTDQVRWLSLNRCVFRVDDVIPVAVSVTLSVS